MDERTQWKEQITQKIQTIPKRGLLLPLLILLGGGLLIFPGGPSQSESAPPAQSEQEFSTYEHALEQRLEELISKVDGAGKTRVMVTLASSPMNVYATDMRDSMNGTEETHVLLKDGNALKETTETPEIGGVAVLCEGGDNVKVAAKIHEILSSLLGLSTGRISVAKMN